MSLQQFFVDPRLEVETFETGGGGHLDEIFEAGLILAEQSQVVTRVLHPSRASIKTTSGRDVGLVTNDWIDVLRFRLFVKFQGTVQVAVIGQCEGVHTVALGTINQSIDGTRTIQQAVVAVAMKVCEWTVSHSGFVLLLRVSVFAG